MVRKNMRTLSYFHGITEFNDKILLPFIGISVNATDRLTDQRQLWATSEPSGGTVENHMMIFEGTWGDVAGFRTFPFLCDRNF